MRFEVQSLKCEVQRTKRQRPQPSHPKMRALGLTLALLLFCVPALAQPKPYVPAGSPPSPKVAARWNRFHTYNEAS